MSRLPLTAILMLLLATIAVAQDRSVGSVKKERAATHKQIDETSGRLEANKQATAKSLRELNAITVEITEQEEEISRLERQVRLYDRRIKLMNDSIAQSQERLARLRQNYGMAVRKMRTHSSALDRLVFIFSSKSVGEAYRRVRRLRQFAKWRDKQSADIRAEVARIEERRSSVEQLKYEQITSRNELTKERKELVTRQNEQSAIVAGLREQEEDLKALLAEQNRRAIALDRELDRLIALEQERERQRIEAERRKAEQERERQRLEAERQRQIEEQRKAEEQRRADERRKADEAAAAAKADKSTETPASPAKSNSDASTKAASNQPVAPAVQQPAIDPQKGTKRNDKDINESTLAADFERKKGKLPYPVSGNCRIVRGFGRQQHPELKHVMTDNGGVDIDAPRGAEARSVADGKVSAVFRQDGYDMVVMVRHGKYLTIFVNLSQIYVTVGQVVKAGDPIGKVATDATTGDRALLHFEIRNERTKLNPAEWLQTKK